MHSYTIRVEKGSRGGAPWETVVFDETITDTRPAQEICDEIAQAKTRNDGHVWHIQVWGANPVTVRKPDGEVYKRLLP